MLRQGFKKYGYDGTRVCDCFTIIGVLTIWPFILIMFGKEHLEWSEGIKKFWYKRLF